MKPPPFDYHRATTVGEVVDLLSRLGPEAKILAGGQSLLPMMKLRLVRPVALIDLARVPDLGYVRRVDGVVAFGAMARLYELESDQVRSASPLLTAAADHIGHTAIRHRGTVCGSLAHADPAAELPAVALALDAEMRVTGPSGDRTIPARDFFVGYFGTAMAPGEYLVEARFPVLPPRAGWGFEELSRRKGDFAIAAVAAVVELGAGQKIAKARIALAAVADRAIRCPEAEAVLAGASGDDEALQAAAAAAVANLDPPTDVHGSAVYRRRLARVLVHRALRSACERARAATPRT